MRNLWKEVDEALPTGMHIMRASLVTNRDNEFNFTVECHRYHDEGGSLHLMSKAFDFYLTPDKAIQAALLDILAQLEGRDDTAN